MTAVYFINSWRESRAYFMSFGWTGEEIERMEAGEIIKRDGNTYRIIVKED